MIIFFLSLKTITIWVFKIGSYYIYATYFRTVTKNVFPTVNNFFKDFEIFSTDFMWCGTYIIPHIRSETSEVSSIVSNLID